MVINLQFFGGRGASSGISEKGNAYGTQYKILLEYENIKFVTNAGKNYEALMETMTNGRTYVQIGGEEILRIVQMDENNRRNRVIEFDKKNKQPSSVRSEGVDRDDDQGSHHKQGHPPHIGKGNGFTLHRPPPHPR